MAYTKKQLKDLLNPAGRKKKIKTVADFVDGCVDYFTTCDTDGVCPDNAGLAFHLGFADKKSLRDYESYTDDKGQPYLPAIKRAKAYIYKVKKEWLMSGEGSGNGFNI